MMNTSFCGRRGLSIWFRRDRRAAAGFRRQASFGLGSVFAVLAALALVSACTSKGGDSGGVDRPNPTLPIETLGVGPAQVRAEIARTTIQRERGLMFRTSVPDGTGMFFVFSADQHLSFWMKNTFVPLSLAYISSDGTITQIVDLEPRSLEAIQSDRSVRYALEVPQGWFARAGVKVGDKVRLPSGG